MDNVCIVVGGIVRSYGAFSVVGIGMIVVVRYYDWLLLVTSEDTVGFFLYVNHDLTQREGYDTVNCVEGSFDVLHRRSIFLTLACKAVEHV